MDWSFYADWEHDPLLCPPAEYLVFIFHSANHSDYAVDLIPSYTLICPPRIRYAANEEIAMYIEDAVENELDLKDQTPVAFEVPPHATRHYIAAFEKPEVLTSFDVDVDVFRDVTWHLQFEKGATIERCVKGFGGNLLVEYQ